MESVPKQYTIDPEVRQRLNILLGANQDEKINYPRIKKYPELLKVLKLIPIGIFHAFANQTQPVVPEALQIIKHKKFQNWGETVTATYNQILYPTELPPEQQIQSVQDFVRNSLTGIGKRRVRGAGIRHSWSNIFSDPNQYLVSFYPYKIATGTSGQLEGWANQMLGWDEQLQSEGVQHLCSIRHVGERTEGTTTKHLVKIGAGVSNEQMRLWCIKNGYQYLSNVIMVEVNVCGGIGTCSHGAGINTQTLSDYIYEIQYIDYNGNRQTISKETDPQLIMSAASNLGLLGLTIFVTLEMEQLDIIEFQPRNTYKDLVIPWPRNYAKVEQRRQRQEYQQWLSQHQGAEPSWDTNYENFKTSIHKNYCQWFYFPIQGTNVFENCWQVYGKKTPQLIEEINSKPDSQFMDVYPDPISRKLSEFALFLGNVFINHQISQASVSIFMRNPYLFFPKQHVYANYPDGVHFQRGIQNMKVRDIEVEINVPTINGELDYDLIQRLWWVALEIVENKKDLVNIALEMRLFKGSNATLAPEIGYEYVCSIEILRSMTFTAEQEDAWTNVSLEVFNAWKNERDSLGRPVLIRPHWGKEWSAIHEVKQHVLDDTVLTGHFSQFLNDYREICLKKGLDANKSLSVFSNALYRELLNNAIGQNGIPIK